MTFDLVPEIPRLRAYARFLTRSRTDADDLLQDCLIRALEKQALWQPTSPLAAWLSTMMYRIHINNARSTARLRRVLERQPERSVAPERADILVIVRDAARVLDRLPVEQKRLVIERAMEGLSYDELAEREQVPVGTVRSRLNRGRALLREHEL